MLTTAKEWIRWPVDAAAGEEGGQDVEKVEKAVEGMVRAPLKDVNDQGRRMLEEDQSYRKVKNPAEEVDGQGRRILEEGQSYSEEDIDDHGLAEADRANRGSNASMLQSAGSAEDGMLMDLQVCGRNLRSHMPFTRVLSFSECRLRRR